MPLSQFVAIFLLEEVAFLLYTLLILRSLQFCLKFKKKVRPSSKVCPAMAGPTWPVPPGLYTHCWFGGEFSHIYTYLLFTICTLCMYICELRTFFVIIGRQFPNWIPTHALIKTNWQISDPKFLKLIRFQFPLTTYLVSFRYDAELVWDKVCWAIIRKPRNLRHNRQMETEVLSHACRQWADFNLVSSQIFINLAFINIYGNIFV